MSKLKEQAPAIVVTALVMGALLGGYAYYVNAKVLPAQRRAMDEMRFAHEAALERSAAELGSHEQLGTSGQTYHHLRQLVSAGWLRSTGRGRYAIPPERVIPLLVTIAAVAR